MKSDCFVIWRDKVDSNVLNLGSKGARGNICCWGQVHIDSFWDWFNDKNHGQGEQEYLKILRLAEDGPVDLTLTMVIPD